MTIQQLCRHITSLTHTPVHIYDLSGAFIAVCEDYSEQQDLLKCDSAFCQQLIEKTTQINPCLYMEEEDILYGAVRGEDSVFLLGPCCLSTDVCRAAGNLQRLHGLSPDVPYVLNTISLELFSHLVLMLTEMTTDISIETDELLLSSFCDESVQEHMDMQIHKNAYANQEEAFLHNPYQQELREQESIRMGDLDALMSSLQEVYVGQVGRMSSNALRQAKYNAAAVIAVACRSAIAGGLPAEVAFSLSDSFFQMMDDQQNEAAVIAIMRQAEIQYCKMVHNLTAVQGEGPMISDCKDLVMQQLHSKISVQSLAEQLNVSAKYLSSVFADKVGLPLKRYIIKEKIHFAKNRLIYTDDTCKDIAYTFGFSSQSHFGAEFKKEVGMSPGQFRRKYGRAAR